MATIRELRTERGWSQQDLAVKLGVTSSTVYNWERGKFEPTASKFKALALAFSVPMEAIDLIEEDPGSKKAAA
jgi:transcriptional regulator with XRE-family HTH domain